MTQRDIVIIKVSELYIGILGRAPDFIGLNYWVNQILDGSLSLENTRASFASPDQPEYWDIYGDLDNGELLDKIYTNFLERTADAEGREYWLEELDSGDIATDQMIVAIINAAQDPAATDEQTLIDAQVLANKVEAAITFVTETQSFVAAGSADFIDFAQGAVNEVTEDHETVASSQAATLSLVAAQPAYLVGTYVSAEQKSTLSFLGGGSYVQIQNESGQGQDGFEFGSWTYDEDNGLLALNVILDTNGNAGMVNGPGTLTIDANITTQGLTLGVADEALALSKLTADAGKAEVGSWIGFSYNEDQSVDAFFITNLIDGGLLTSLDFSFTNAEERYVSAGNYIFEGDQLSVSGFTASGRSADPESFVKTLVPNLDHTLTLSGVDGVGTVLLSYLG
ncbi:MAG: DUF4214 domain-containing protein [Porticoccaceae bacterium]|nr:DUF4214 domain-containing protein [Porticoccaceae bacterium]